jgi:tetratricopeptide (TPR) repeat protein
MLATWVVAGTLIVLQTATMREYVGLLDAQGLRGAAEASTPLRQVIPARNADAQMWVRHALAGSEAGVSRVRFTTADNAPVGREVHWSSGFAWLLRGAAALQASLVGPPARGPALERVLLWFNAPLLFAVIVLWSGWTARRAGVWAGVLLAFALVGHQRFQEAFAPTYVDHHGLVNAAILGLVLGAAFMGFGWWRPAAGAGSSLLPEAPARARRAALVSALSGAVAMWLNAASALPAIAVVGLGGLAVAGWHGPKAQAGGARFDPGVWRLWGRTGAIASGVCYLLEYAPGHLGWRLEVNHPLYSLAWWGGAELVGMLCVRRVQGGRRPPGAVEPTGEFRTRPEVAFHLKPFQLILPLIAIAAPPVAILVGGPATFLPGDPFVAGLRHFVAESRSLPAVVREFGVGMVAYDLFSVLIMIPAALLLWRRRDDTRLVLGALTLTTGAFLLLAFSVVRWWVVASAVQITLLVWLVASGGVSPRWRRTVSLVAAGVLFILPALWRINRDHRANQRRSADAGDLFQPLYRDLAATLRASQPEGDVILLASPNASAGISYFGRFQSLGTLFWENAPGLRAAAEILCAESDEEALRLIRARGATHVVLLSAAPFVGEYFSLLHPARPVGDASRTFGFRLVENPAAAPPWLQPIPYRQPADLAGTGGNVGLFKVVPGQTEDQRLFHIAVAQAARGETAAAEQSFLSALALVPAAARATLCGFAGESAYEQGADALAVRMFRRALQLGNNADVANIAAWIMATSADSAVRDGVAALALVNPLAQRNPNDPVFVSTLAAACAEVGRFDEAVQAAERALALVRQGGGDEQSVSLLAQRLATYRAKRPWRQ